MRLRLAMAKVKPASSPRARIISRVCSDCSGVAPYFSARCSSMSWPPGGICGLSSNGWKWISVLTSSPSRAIAASSALSPITHQGQETSETKSIFIGVFTVYAPRRTSCRFHRFQLKADARKVHVHRAGAHVAAAQGVARARGRDQFAFGRLQAEALGGDGHAAAARDAVVVLERVFFDADRRGLRRHRDRGGRIRLLHAAVAEGGHAVHPGGEAGRGIEYARYRGDAP